MIGHKFAPLAIVACAYAAVGAGSAAMANAASTIPVRDAWRLGAFAASAVIFAMHIWFEFYRRNHSARVAARYTSNSVEIAAIALAAIATAHQLSLPPTARAPYFGAALIVWPLLTGIASFFAALILCALLSRTPWRPQATRVD